MPLLQKVYRLLSFRDRSEKEIRDYLRGKTENPEQIINQLKEQGLINDERFAEEWVESRRRSRKLGMRVIKQELMQKGIDKELINRIMNLNLRIKNEEEVAKEALQKKKIEIRQKAINYLMRKGFDYEVVKEVVDNFWQKR